MKNERLDRISDLCASKRSIDPKQVHLFVYRVTFKVKVRDSAKPQESSFAYRDLLSARRCYRDILLSLYKGKGIHSFAICLNRHGTKPWEKPIHLESVTNEQH